MNNLPAVGLLALQEELSGTTVCGFVQSCAPPDSSHKSMLDLGSGGARWQRSDHERFPGAHLFGVRALRQGCPAVCAPRADTGCHIHHP